MNYQPFAGCGTKPQSSQVGNRASGNSFRFYRIDGSHHASSEAESSSSLATAGGLAAGDAESGWRLPTGFLKPASISRTSGARCACDTWVQAGGRQNNTLEEGFSKGFEAMVARWLDSNPRQRAELSALARMLVADRSALDGGTLFVSLAEETDVPRLLVGLAWLAHRPGPIVLADADWQQGHLSQLCQKQHIPGWAEVCRGWVTARETLRPLAIPGVWLLPAGNRLCCAMQGARYPAELPHGYLKEQVSSLSGQCSQLWWNAGTWPHCQPNDAWRLASRLLVVVRLNQTRWDDIDKFQGVLESLGRKVDGCVVFGAI